MAGPEQQIQTLQRFVDNFATDAGTMRAALRDAATTPAARRLLVGALNYVLDALDIFPDHYKGLGLADDALVFRVAAAQAVAAGCRHDGIVMLAADHDESIDILGDDVAKSFETFVSKLAERPVRGRTGDKVLADGDTSAVFHADLDRELARHVTSKITPGPAGAAGVISELRKMSKHALKKAGLS